MKSAGLDHLNKRFYHGLTQLIEGDAFTTVEHEKERNGLEVWRLLVNFWDPVSRGKHREG